MAVDADRKQTPQVHDAGARHPKEGCLLLTLRWRRVHKIDPAATFKRNPDLFGNTYPYAWHGMAWHGMAWQNGNVFCVAFIVGGISSWQPCTGQNEFSNLTMVTR